MASVLCHIDIPMLIHLNHVNLLSHFSFMTLPIVDAKLGPTHGRTRSCSEQWHALQRRSTDRSNRSQGLVRLVVAGEISDETFER